MDREQTRAFFLQNDFPEELVDNFLSAYGPNGMTEIQALMAVDAFNQGRSYQSQQEASTPAPVHPPAGPHTAIHTHHLPDHPPSPTSALVSTLVPTSEIGPAMSQREAATLLFGTVAGPALGASVPGSGRGGATPLPAGPALLPPASSSVRKPPSPPCNFAIKNPHCPEQRGFSTVVFHFSAYRASPTGLQVVSICCIPPTAGQMGMRENASRRFTCHACRLAVPRILSHQRPL